MNELLQKHGCSNVFTVPEGLKELMSDITREVLREQPPKINDFIADYLSALLITREHGILAVKLLDELCDCKPTVSDHLLKLGIEKENATAIAQVIKEEIEATELAEGKEKVKEIQMVKRILQKQPLDEDVAAIVCQVARNAYKDYWYRKKLLEEQLKTAPNEPWEIAARHTLEIYMKTKPSFTELNRASKMIQAAYRGYHVRRHLLRHLKPKKTGPKVDLPGPPIDIAESREMDLGHIINIQVKDEDTGTLFDIDAVEKFGLRYDPMKTITHVYEDKEPMEKLLSSRRSKLSTKSVLSTTETKSKGTSTPGLKLSRLSVENEVTGSQRIGRIISNSNMSQRSVRIFSEAEVKEINFDDISEPQGDISEEELREHDVVETAEEDVLVPESIEAYDVTPVEDADVPLEETVESSEVPEGDIPQEVAEDVAVAATDESEAADVPSSAPVTSGDGTDVEDMAGDISAEEGED